MKVEKKKKERCCALQTPSALSQKRVLLWLCPRGFTPVPCYNSFHSAMVRQFQKYSIPDEWWAGFPGGTSHKESACQCRRHRRRVRVHLFCVRKIPWNRKWQPPPVFLPGGPVDRRDWRPTVHGITESQPQLKTLDSLFWNYTLMEVLQISVKEKSSEIR